MKVKLSILLLFIYLNGIIYQRIFLRSTRKRKLDQRGFMNSTVSILASFATLKELNDSKRYINSYQILSEFIIYVINEQKIVSFSAAEMKQKISDIFGFNLPEAVVKTTSKHMPSITTENGVFLVNKALIKTDKALSSMLSLAESKSSKIIRELINFVVQKCPGKEVKTEDVTKDLIAFLIDDPQKSCANYTDLISEYILLHESDAETQKNLDSIREGSILYIGLNYNINETGSLRKSLTLYLDTEILFSLVGYNGKIYETLAKDFYSQVCNANSKDKKISLRYFADVKKEIDDFFKSAELIVCGGTYHFDKPAMKSIVNGCSLASDVIVKKSDFYHLLICLFGIIEEDEKDYYSEENHAYNLESLEYADPQEQEGWKFISYINILRRGKITHNNTDSEYLLVTNTGHILKTSQMQSEKLKTEHNLEHISDFAVSLDRITNILWYKLGNGFGSKEYPNNVKSILKAKMVLASSISHNVVNVYNEANEQYKCGKISQEQLAARILGLRQKPVMPEELTDESIEESMDFSLEYLCRFEEEVNANRTALQEKDKKLAQKETIIQTQLEEKKILEQSKKSLQLELAQYHEKERKEKERKDKIKRTAKFIWSIFWKILVIIILTAIAVLLEIKFDSNIPLYVCAAIDAIGLAFTIWIAIKKDYSKYIHNDTKLDSAQDECLTDKKN